MPEARNEMEGIRVLVKVGQLAIGNVNWDLESEGHCSPNASD